MYVLSQYQPVSFLQELNEASVIVGAILQTGEIGMESLVTDPRSRRKNRASTRPGEAGPRAAALNGILSWL